MKKFLDIKNHDLEALINIVHDTKRVNDPVHNMYQYPASFSPKFASIVINSFSRKGDYIFDPFMGGGTSIIEAVKNGRNVIGNDINSLSFFLAKTKSQKLSNNDRLILDNWLKKIIEKTKKSDIKKIDKISLPKHMTRPSTKKYMEWIEFYIKKTKSLTTKNQRNFCLLILLRVSKRVLDAHKKPLGLDKFRNLLVKYFTEGLKASSDYSNHLISLKKSSKKLKNLKIELYNSHAVNLSKDIKIIRKKPKLIITSPPYPGVNINYNRWQINGKLDTDLPYYIINKKESYQKPYFHFGSNSLSDGLTKKYMKNALDIYSGLYNILSDDGYLIQLVGFADIQSQFEFFLNVLALSGFHELKIKKLNGKGDGRIWREVPSRKWHASQKGKLQSSNEVLLIHKKIKMNGGIQ